MASTSANTQLLYRESLPEEDPETQAVLMRRVLEIIMEVECLTPTERVSVQDNLAGLHSSSHTVGTFTQPGQQRYTSLC
jgi:hypothetical protein